MFKGIQVISKWIVLLLKELEEENFVITSLLNAAEEGNVEAIEELTDSSTHFDINISNRVRNRLVVDWFDALETAIE